MHTQKSTKMTLDKSPSSPATKSELSEVIQESEQKPPGGSKLQTGLGQ